VSVYVPAVVGVKLAAIRQAPPAGMAFVAPNRQPFDAALASV
jgi:hypothetical protein